MGRRSSIKAAPDPIRAEIERMLRADRFSLDEMRDMLIRQFPDLADRVPTRSSLGRYKQSLGPMIDRMRDIDAASRVVVAELGENPDERAGALLMQTITTLATHAALKVGEKEDGASIGEVKELARAAKNVMDARRISLKERQEIREEARKELLRDQQEKLGHLVKAGTIPAETIAIIQRDVYGL